MVAPPHEETNQGSSDDARTAGDGHLHVVTTCGTGTSYSSGRPPPSTGGGCTIRRHIGAGKACAIRTNHGDLLLESPRPDRPENRIKEMAIV